MFLVGVVFHFLVPLIAPGIKPQYANLSLYRDWKGWTSTYMLIHPFLYASVFAAVFLKLRHETSFPAGINGGVIYVAGVFCVVVITEPKTVTSWDRVLGPVVGEPILAGDDGSYRR